MSIAIGLAAITAVATGLGGVLALRARDRLHLVLGLSAGLLLGLVGFDLLPEVFRFSDRTFAGVPAVSLAILIGFLVLHFIEQFLGSHEPAESEYGDDHTHQIHIAGTIGSVAMGGHVFLDGLALGVAFHVSNSLGWAVFFAVLTHAFSDGLNTVSLLIKSGHWNRRATLLLLIDAPMRIGGSAVATSLTLNDHLLALYLAGFAGMLIYLATSHILPEAHSRHPSRLTLVATILGVGLMWLIVAVIGQH